MERRDDYKFLPLRDAETSINQKVNIIAVILEFGFPKSTKGTDECCILRVIDETHNQTGLSVVIYADNVERLPRVAAPGDVIQLFNVVVKAHDGEVNVVFNKSFSSFALYKGKDDDDFVPYQAYSKFCPRDLDKMFVDKLRKWLINFQFHEDSSDFPMFREIKEGQFNLACKILLCREAAKDKWFIYVWDGTDAPPNVVSSKLNDELRSPLELQPEPLPLPRDLLCTLPTVGSILRITFDMPIRDTQLHVLEIGKWVKFVNVRLEVHNGLWVGAFTPYTKLRFTPNQDHLIIERLRLYDERILLNSRTKSGCLPQSVGSLSQSLRITEVKHDTVRHLTLMDVLTYSELVAKFKCVVRVVAALPYLPTNLCNASGIYRMRLTLEDPTARIHGLVYDEDGEALFECYPGFEKVRGKVERLPEVEEKREIEKVRGKLNRLLGVAVDSGADILADGSPRNPPWVSVCIKSYCVSDTDDWENRMYRIFDTKIV